MKLWRSAIVLFALLSLLTGVVYPVSVTLLAQVCFPFQSQGSIRRSAEGSSLGSQQIGQPFDAPQYFWGRLSATAGVPYQAAASSGSNLGPMSPALVEAAQTRIHALRAAGAPAEAPVPIDLVTASGSGLDPHISPAAAEYQLSRVARARALDETQVRQLVEQFTEPRTLGVLGEPRVNVLSVNLALDELTSQR